MIVEPVGGAGYGREDWSREIEDLLAERGIIVSYEAIRQWCRRFSSEYARRWDWESLSLGRLIEDRSRATDDRRRSWDRVR